MAKQKYFPTDDQLKAIFSEPLVNSAILEKQIGLPKKYIQRLRNQNGIYPKKKNIDVYEFIDIYDKYKSSDKVAEYFNVSDSYVVKFAQQIGYVNDNYKISKNTEEAVIESYISGIDNKTIFETYNISQTSLYRILQKNNIKPNKDRKKYLINENVFDVIDTPEKAYLIGFIAADGSVSSNHYSLKITINKKDEEILHLFKKVLNSNAPIAYCERNKNEKKYYYASLTITNKHIVEALNNIGILQRKTWGNTIPNINDKYFKDFVRGYFDGDGCITNVKYKNASVSISGFENNMNKIAQKLIAHNIISCFTVDKRKYNLNDITGRFGCLNFTNNTQRYCFLKWIYENDNDFHLNRKYSKAMQFILDIENSEKINDQQAVIYYKYAVRGVG